MPRRVAITGIGVVAPNGTTTEQFWDACLSGEQAVAPIPAHWHDYADYHSTLWAPLPEIDYSAYDISRTEQLQTDPMGLMGICAAHQAIDSAGLVLTRKNPRLHSYTIEGIDANRTGVFMGTGQGGVSSLLASHAFHIQDHTRQQLNGLACDEPQASEIAQIRDRMRMPRRFHPFVVPVSMPNASSCVIGIRFSLFGVNHTSSGACAAGTMAIGQAMRAIRDGRIDTALAGGVEYPIDDTGAAFRGFDAAGALVQNCQDPAKANRPFDKQRSGFLISQGGAGVLMLEEMERARTRGARIYAELAGYAETFDAFSLMMLEESGVQIERAIRDSIADAGISPQAVAYINAHGTGTKVNDEVESNVLERVFGTHAVVNSTKSLIGHSLGASGAIEAIVTALSLYHRRTHGNANLEDPLLPLNFAREAQYFDGSAAISESFAFGGHNAVLTLKRV